MSLTSTADRIQYVGNGATTAFTFPYYFLADGDLVVYVSDSDGTDPVLQTITTDYTVSGAGNPSGGTVTFVTAPASGKIVDIYRWVAPTQGIEFNETGPLSAETIEQALDRLTMVTQQIVSRVGGATFSLSGLESLGRDPDDPTAWDAESDRITGLATPTAATDAVTKSYADAIVATAGNVPAPSDPADDGKVLTAAGGVFSWVAIPASLVPTPADPADDGKHLSADSGAYILRTAAQSRTDLGLGTAAVKNTGTTTGLVPLLGTISATTSLAGLIEFATAIEVFNGTDTFRTPSVSTMKNHRGVVKAWCNFKSSGTLPTGTYSQTGTTVTVSITAHGVSVGMYVDLNYTSGSPIATDGFYQVTSADVNTYTVEDPASQSASGNVTQNLFMTNGYGISSIAYQSAGVYLITLSPAFDDTTYAWLATARRSGITGAGAAMVISNGSTDTKSTTQLLIRSTVSSSAGVENVKEASVWFIGEGI